MLRYLWAEVYFLWCEYSVNKANTVAEKYAEAAECLLAAKKIDATCSSVASMIEKFKKTVQDKSSTIDEKVKEKMKDL